MGHYLSHTKKLLIINDAKMVRDFSTKQSQQFRIRNSLLTYDSSNIVKSLFLMEANEDWKRIRSIISPAFTSGKLKQMISPIEKIATNFVTHLRPMAKSGELFDLKRFISGFSMDVIAKCGYGIELDSLSVPNHPIVVNARKILNIDASLGRICRVMFPSIASKMGINFFNAEAVGYFDKLTFDIVERRRQNTGKRKCKESV